MTIRYLIFASAASILAACGAPEGSSGNSRSADSMDGLMTVSGLPNPCDWLSATEAQAILSLDIAPQQVAMGGAQTSQRSCYYSDPEQTKSIDVSHRMLNPQIVDTTGKSAAELSDIAATTYGYGMNHLESLMSGDTTIVAFGNAEQTILIAFSSIGRARDLPEGMPAAISARMSISGYINPTLLLFDAGQSQEQRLATLKRLIDRPIAQLHAARNLPN